MPGRLARRRRSWRASSRHGAPSCFVLSSAARERLGQILGRADAPVVQEEDARAARRSCGVDGDDVDAAAAQRLQHAAARTPASRSRRRRPPCRRVPAKAAQVLTPIALPIAWPPILVVAADDDLVDAVLELALRAAAPRRSSSASSVRLRRIDVGLRDLALAAGGLLDLARTPCRRRRRACPRRPCRRCA